MKKILQRIVASDGSGDCVQASVASILNLEYEDVPDMCPNTKNQAGITMQFLREHGYSYEGILYNPNYHLFWHTDQFSFCAGTHHIISEEFTLSTENLKKYSGIDGLFLATVFSPKFTRPYQGLFGHHQVICDKNLNIVHDPGPDYQHIVQYPLSNMLGLNGICMVELYVKDKTL